MSFGEHFRPVNGIILQIKYSSIKASTNLNEVITGKDIDINLGELHDPAYIWDKKSSWTRWN